MEPWTWWWWWLSWWCPSKPNPNLNLAAAGLTPGGIGGAEGPGRIFVGGLPYYFTEVQIRELLESFGPLRGFDLVKDRDTGNSKGYGLCVYEDQAATDVACAALNGLKMGDKTLIVRRATISKHGFFGAMKVINADKLMDDGEYEEILEDMREEGRKFGNLFNNNILLKQVSNQD
uniref:RRM domain-containing protein n=1 Tax=Lactuca sativa TaxID=4236 RepID=A0A9R1XTH2_LACSA|nr:hypothetical protein LSAT_V11C200072250 [Lactuca sativa]